MAQNTIPPELQKLMAQMPSTGANLPTLNGNANPLAAGMAMNTPQPQVQAPAPQVAEGVRAGRAQQRRDQVGGVSAPTLTMQPSRAEQLQGVEAVPFSMTGGATRTEGRVGKNRPEIATPATVDAPSVFSDQPKTTIQPQPPTTPLPQPGQEGFRFAERGSPQDFFLSQTNDGATPLSQEQIERGQAFAEERGMNFDPTTGFSTGTQTPAPQGLTTQSGTPLAQFLSGGAIPEAGLAAESPLYSSESRGISGEAGQDIMAQESAARMAGTFSPAGAGSAVSDRERRMATGEGTSTADLTDMAKANAPGASPSDVARGQKVADSLGVDLNTGKPLAAKEGLTFDQQLALRKQAFTEGKYKSEQVDKATTSYNAALQEAQEAKTAEQKSVSVGRGLTQSVDDMITVMDRAAGRLDQFFSTGMTGKFSSFWKGSDADSQESDFGFLKSNVALNAMMELKANSSTGSTGFGALNTEELKVLQSQFAALDPFNDPEVVRKNLAQLQGRFDGIIRNAYDQHKADYGEEAANNVYGKMIDRLDSRKQPEGQATTGATSTQTKSGNYTVEVSY